MSTGEIDDLKWLGSVLEKYREVKTELLGPKSMTGAKQQLAFLNRAISWEEAGIRYEADPRHAEIIIAQLELQNAKLVGTPGVKDTVVKSLDDSENPKLSPEQASGYRGLAARSNFLAQDRADIQYAFNEISRWMATPRRGDWEGLRRMVRYLLGRPRATIFYQWQTMPKELTAYSDTDWAGCKSSRRSNSGGMVMHGSHMIRSSSRMQNLVALSSAEAELYGTVRAASELLGVRSLARDLGNWPSARLYADASAALGIIHRQGLGKLRHIDTNSLWLQQAARQKVISFLKVPGEDNHADMLTKHLAEESRVRHVAAVYVHFLLGRPAISPALCLDSLSVLEAPETIPTSHISTGNGRCALQITDALSWADYDYEDSAHYCVLHKAAV